MTGGRSSATLTHDGVSTDVEVPPKGITIDQLLEHSGKLSAAGKGAMVMCSRGGSTTVGSGCTVVMPGDQVTVVPRVIAG